MFRSSSSVCNAGLQAAGRFEGWIKVGLILAEALHPNVQLPTLGHGHQPNLHGTGNGMDMKKRG